MQSKDDRLYSRSKRSLQKHPLKKEERRPKEENTSVEHPQKQPRTTKAKQETKEKKSVQVIHKKTIGEHCCIKCLSIYPLTCAAGQPITLDACFYLSADCMLGFNPPIMMPTKAWFRIAFGLEKKIQKTITFFFSRANNKEKAKPKRKGLKKHQKNQALCSKASSIRYKRPQESTGSRFLVLAFCAIALFGKIPPEGCLGR